MKLINLIIGKMFKEELKEIAQLLKKDCNKQREYEQRMFEYADSAEKFLEIKERIRKLDNFLFQLDSENILDTDLYSIDSPIYLLGHEKKINEIIDKTLSKNNNDSATFPEGVSTAISPMESKDMKPIPIQITINHVNNTDVETTIKSMVEKLKNLGVTIY